MNKKKAPPVKRLVVHVRGENTLPWDRVIREFEANALKAAERPQVAKLKNAIVNRGFNFPFYVWDGHRYIIDGAGRIKALAELEQEGYTIPDLPVVMIEAASLEEAKILSLQASSAYGEITKDSFEAFTAELPDVDALMGELSFDEFKFFQQMEVTKLPPGNAPEGDPDEVPEAEGQSKPGDLYEIGGHRLLCGDSTMLNEVETLMDGEKADMVFTDPPYGVSYADKNKFLNAVAFGNRIQRKIETDHETPEAMQEFWFTIFTNLLAVASDKASYYVTGPQGGDLLLLLLLTAIKDAGWQLKHMLIWVKNNHVLGRSDYHYKHEPILYGWKQNGTHSFYGDKSQTSVWEIPKPQKSDLHPTMKPVALVEKALQNSTERDHLVVDLFGGSGTTMVAAETTGRRCFMMEKDPHYCDVIVARMRKLWPDIPVLRNGEAI